MKIIYNCYLIFALLFITGCQEKKEEKKVEKPKPLHVKEKPLHVKITEIENELKQIDTTRYLEDYIVDIIKNGSDNNLGFPAGAMDGGYAYENDALNIARYIVTLSNQKSSDNKAGKKAEIFYTSNCGGCHGHDGQGLNGAFPNLTLKPILGIQKRKEFLKTRLSTLKAKLNN